VIGFEIDEFFVATKGNNKNSKFKIQNSKFKIQNQSTASLSPLTLSGPPS